MSLHEQLGNDLKSALKQGDTLKVSTIRLLRAQLRNEEIAKGEDLTGDEETAVLTNAAKKRKEAIEIYEKSARADLLQKEQKELEIISSYLPEQLSPEEIKDIVNAVIKEVQANSLKDLGKVMGAAMKQLKGKADGKLVQEIARNKLA